HCGRRLRHFSARKGQPKVSALRRIHSRKRAFFRLADSKKIHVVPVGKTHKSRRVSPRNG
ncbi:MAG TPA: hypothetical protein DD629_03805, partial [Treponema sp.]|nr:hypothetical protein [Treponema sp.]